MLDFNRDRDKIMGCHKESRGMHRAQTLKGRQ